MSDSITSTNTKIANTVEDIFKVLLKLLDEKEGYLKDKEFLKTMKDKNTIPVFLSMNTMAAKKLTKEMDKIGIPYMQFKVKGSTNDVILIRSDDKKRVQDLENSIRIHAGLEIDTKEELDRALCLTDPKAKEFIISGLTEYEADRIIQLSQNSKERFTVVKQEMNDGKFIVATHEKNTAMLSRYAIVAILENETKTKEMSNLIQGKHYLNQQKKEFEVAVEEVREKGQTKPAYIFSLTNPERYIKIQEFGFEIVDRGIVTHSMNIASNPELYPDILKLIGSSVENPIFKLESEVKELGGMQNALNEAKSHIPGSIIIKNYPYDTAFKNWVNDTLGTGNGYIFENAGSIKELNVEMFAQMYLMQRPQDKEVMEMKIPYYKKQLESLYERLQDVKATKEIPKIRFNDILAKNGIDVELHEEFYSEQEIERIKQGAYQKDYLATEEQITSDNNDELPNSFTKHDISERDKAIMEARKAHMKQDKEREV